MYCPECKINYKGDFKYCITCNEELLVGKICLHCHTINSENTKICSLCGEFFEEDGKKIYSKIKSSLDKTYKYCSNCIEEFPNNKIFCPKCGGKLEIKLGSLANVISSYKKESIFSKILSYFKVF